MAEIFEHRGWTVTRVASRRTLTVTERSREATGGGWCEPGVVTWGRTASVGAGCHASTQPTVLGGWPTTDEPMASIDQYQVEEWLDTDVFQDVSREPYESAAFRFAVTCSGRVSTVSKSDDGPLLVVAEGALDERDAASLRDLSAPARRELKVHLQGVLADVPGIYRFQDLAGQDVPFEGFEAIRLEHRLFPESLDRQTLVDTVLELTKALLYVETLVADALETA